MHLLRRNIPGVSARVAQTCIVALEKSSQDLIPVSRRRNLVLSYRLHKYSTSKLPLCSNKETLPQPLPSENQVLQLSDIIKSSNAFCQQSKFVKSFGFQIPCFKRSYSYPTKNIPFQIKDARITTQANPMRLQIKPFSTQSHLVNLLSSGRPNRNFTNSFTLGLSSKYFAQNKAFYHLSSKRHPSLCFGSPLILAKPVTTTACFDDPAANIPDKVTGLTPKMVSRLKCLASAIKPDSETHGVNIFQRVFHMDNSIQRMFPKFACEDPCSLHKNPEFIKQVNAFMKAFVYNMEVCGNVSEFKSNLARQNQIHKDLCIPDKYFITFGHAINDYLKETLGCRYSEDVECAVAYYWRFVAAEITAKPTCPKCGATIVKAAAPASQPTKTI